MITVVAKSCRAAELPRSDAWLSASEQAVLGQMTIEKRRRDYRLGRRAARLAFGAAVRRAAPDAVIPAIAVRAAEDGAPELVSAIGETLDWVLSISHSGDLGVAAVAACQRLGCDVEQIEPRSDELVRQFFTPAERERIQAAVPAERAAMANLVWSAKESALKALRTGLRADTRSVEVSFSALPAAAPWGQLEASVGPERLSGHFALLGPEREWVFTLLADAPCAPPLGLIE